jgi:hypothetical protein
MHLTWNGFIAPWGFEASWGKDTQRIFPAASHNYWSSEYCERYSILGPREGSSYLFWNPVLPHEDRIRVRKLFVPALVNIYYNTKETIYEEDGYVRSIQFEVLSGAIMKSTTFWELMPCSPLNVDTHFGGIYHLRVRGWRVSQARNQHELRTATRCFLAWLTLQPWRWRRHIPPKRRMTYNSTCLYISDEKTLQVGYK